MIYWRALNGSLERVFDVFFGQTRFPARQGGAEEPLLVVKAPSAGEKGA
jgi:hypothetical protein